MQIFTSVSFLERITSINGNIFSVFFILFYFTFYCKQFFLSRKLKFDLFVTHKLHL